MDRYSKWPAASFCTSTDGETAVKFLDQHIRLNGIPKIIRTDKATAFTRRLFRDFCKKHYIKLIYGTPYIHTPTGLVELGVRTLKENLLTNIKAGERFGKALDISLDVLRNDYRKHRKQTEFGGHPGSTKSQTEGGEQQPVNRSQNKILTLRPNNNRDKQNSQERSTVHHKLEQWRNNNRHNRKQESPLAEISANSRRRGM